jgi:hypothetical protein
MAIVERSAGGQVGRFAAGYWSAKAGDELNRMRWKAQHLGQRLVDVGAFDAAGASLAGWISKRVSRGEADRIDQLDYHGLLVLITGLSRFAQRRGWLAATA